MKFSFPPIYAVDYKDKKRNIIKQLSSPARFNIDIEYEEYSKKGIKGWILREKGHKEKILLVMNTERPQEGFDRIIRIKGFKKTANLDRIASSLDFSNKYWLHHPKFCRFPKETENIDLKTERKDAINSWENQFNFIEEIKDKNGYVIKAGLRTPQLGAIHAALSHWTLHKNVATVVMPTGTGKTEVMLSLLIIGLCERLLVVVPTDVLREQISEKFIRLGVLKEFGIIANKAHYPLVGILKHKLQSVDETNQFFKNCNVVVTTMNIAGQIDLNIQKAIVAHTSHLFIDEAHHTEAPTWKKFKELFRKDTSKHIIQFTATPFRNDNRRLDGDVIFRYPMKLAQKEKYFSEINFDPVVEYDLKMGDEAIAIKAIRQLRKDLKKSYDHILMARVNSIKRAETVFETYKDYPEFNPVQIHTGIKSVKERKSIREKIIQKKSRIVVCVDMLGEGFDLPELKIAAFHDIRKSLPITLQVVGRFSRRKKERLGKATVIANRANPEVEDELRELYAQDADWNILLSDMSEGISESSSDLKDFLEGFENIPENLPLQNFRPALSTIIYKTNSNAWKPKKFMSGLGRYNSFLQVYHAINDEKNTLVIVTAKKIPLVWGKLKEEGFFDLRLDLHILYRDVGNNLLFINTSNTNSYYKKLARAVAGNVEIIRGPNLFRCFANITKLRFNNIGVKNIIGKLISFIMRMGKDVGAALTDLQLENAYRAVLFGYGYEMGKRTSMGCSIKGRIWSHMRGNINDLVNWCDFTASKVLDKNIDVKDVLEGALIPELIDTRPPVMPIGIDWPEDIYKQTEVKVSFIVMTGGKEKEEKESFKFESDIDLTDPMKTGALKFTVSSENFSAVYKLALFKIKDGSSFKIIRDSGDKIYIRRENNKLLEDFFDYNPPTIRFSDGSILEGNLLFKLRKKIRSYSKNKIKVWNWNGVNIKKESQGVEKNPASIQYRVIQKLKTRNYDVIFDDDGRGEAADVVTVKKKKKEICVEFYHCKYSVNKKPGNRLADLYEVCGQAQKSIHWLESPIEMFHHLLRRKTIKKMGKSASRIEDGTFKELEIFKEMSRCDWEVKLSVFIVQPGLSKEQIGREQLMLLGVTENYLIETRMVPLTVIASA